ncbi:unnamed protein product [Angiostrongylus costaricensis]|uniref:Uncharacterized protein n=1 Tax=Angiostrongylus costaricensis TaxID=334426 RepID=A0A0R3PFE6_ANGCS|nr:unnamed protein product [Angiostrongylus costaricensis]
MITTEVFLPIRGMNMERKLPLPMNTAGTTWNELTVMHIHSRPDFNGRIGPSHDNNLSRDFSREMQPQNDEYGRELGSRFDRRPDERAERGAGDPCGGAMYNGNGVGTHSSVLNSSAAAVANKLWAKTRIIHPDDHQTTSLEKRRVMMISVRGQYH